MSYNLGKRVYTGNLITPVIGSSTSPVQTIYRASTDFYENDLKFIESSSGDTRLKIKTDGHLAVSEDVEFHSGADVEGINTKQFSVGLDDSGDLNFVIRDEKLNIDRMTIDKSTGKVSFNGGIGMTNITQSTTSDVLYYDSITGTVSFDAVATGATISGTDDAAIFKSGSDGDGDNTAISRTPANGGYTINLDTANKRVGINKTNPQTTLEVGGDTKVDGTFTLAGNTYDINLNNTDISLIESGQYGSTITGGNQIPNRSQHISSDGNVIVVPYTDQAPGPPYPPPTDYYLDVYRWNGIDWNLDHRIFNTNTTGGTGSFTTYLTPDGNNIVYVQSSGNVKIITYSGGSWSSPTTITNTGSSLVNGLCLNDNADRLFLSRSGNVYIFDFAGGSWSLSQTLTGVIATSSGDVSCDSSGDTLAFGDHTETVGGNTATGEVYIYEKGGGTFSLVKTYQGSNAFENFGKEIQLDGNGEHIIIGTWNWPDSRTTQPTFDNGRVEVYKKTGGSWGSVPIYAVNGSVDNQELGFWVAITRDGTRIAYAGTTTPVQIWNISTGSGVFQESINVNSGTGNLSYRSPNYLLTARGSSGLVDVRTWRLDAPTIDTTLDVSHNVDVKGFFRGKTKITNQSSGAISTVNCYGDTIYADTSGGTLTLPGGLPGMNLKTINASGGSVTIAVQSGEYLDDVLNGTDDLYVSTSKPHIYNFICGSSGKWYGFFSGKTNIVNQSSGAISVVNSYGDTIYATTSGGTLTLPSGRPGMNLYTINASGGAITVAVQSGEYLDDVLNGTDDLSVSASKPHIHKFICGASGKWYALH